MKVVKSQPKIKISYSKYENFFTDKNFQSEMYMDDKSAQRPDLSLRQITHKSNKSIKSRSKISLSLNEKAEAALANIGKMGLMQKVQNLQTRKSLHKINYTSTLPPIRTDLQEIEERLKRIKNQMNEVVSNRIKLAKQISSMEASTNQIREKKKAMEKGVSGEETQPKKKQIENVENKRVIAKYNMQILKYMSENLKNGNIILSKRKNKLEERLRQLKLRLTAVQNHLSQGIQNLSKQINNKKVYQSRQRSINEQVLKNAQIAQKNLNQQRKASRLHNKIQSIQPYEQQQFRQETNLQNHLKILNQIRIQQVARDIMNTLFHKDQLIWQQYEKAQNLMLMYAHLNNPGINVQNKVTAQSGFLNSNASFKSLESGQDTKNKFDLVKLYNDSFETKKNLQKIISQKQNRVAILEQKNKELKMKWINLTFYEAQGSKQNSNRQDQLRLIMERQKKADKSKQLVQLLKAFIKKQQQRLNLKFSKKILIPERFSKMLEHIVNQTKK